RSDYRFMVEDGAIRYGLGALKGVGQGAIENLVAVREQIGSFTSLGQLCRETNLSRLNRRALESLFAPEALTVCIKTARRSCRPCPMPWPRPSATRPIWKPASPTCLACPRQQPVVRIPALPMNSPCPTCANGRQGSVCRPKRTPWGYICPATPWTSCAKSWPKSPRPRLRKLAILWAAAAPEMATGATRGAP